MGKPEQRCSNCIFSLKVFEEFRLLSKEFWVTMLKDKYFGFSIWVSKGNVLVHKSISLDSNCSLNDLVLRMGEKLKMASLDCLKMHPNSKLLTFS